MRTIRVSQSWFTSFLYWVSLAALLALILAFLLVIRGEIPHAVGISNETLQVHQDSCACPAVEVSNFPLGFQVLGPVEISNELLNVTVQNSIEVSNFPVGFQVMGPVEISNFPSGWNVTLTDLPLPVKLTNFEFNLSGDVIFPSSFEATITNALTIAGGEVNCTVLNPVTEVTVLNPTSLPSVYPVTGEVNCTVLNPVTEVTVLNPITFPSSTIVQAVTPEGSVINISATSTGSLNVNLREPTTAFGSLMTESLWPIFQTEAVYGVNPSKTSVHVFGTGSVTASNSAFAVVTGTTTGSFATLQSRKRLFYRPGQGSRVMFSALFPQVNSTLVTRIAGIGSPEDGVFFAYVSGLFGILYANRGKREIRTLTITSASLTAESASVTLNSVVYSPPITASGNIQRTVWELSQFTYAGWRAEAVGSTIVFISDQSQPYPGTFVFSATTAMGSFATTRTGSAVTQSFVPQSSWNGDRLDGTGTSGVILDTTKFNLYAISLGYLGASYIRFMTQVIPPGTSDTYFATVHTLQIPNSRTSTTFGNPSFPFSVAARTFDTNSGIINVGSFSGFVEGNIKYSGNRFTFQRSLATTVSSGSYYPFFTIHNSLVRGGVANQGVINILGVSGSVSNTQPATVYLFRSTDLQSHQLGGNPNFAPYTSYTGITYDTSATSFTPTGPEQLIWTRELSEIGSGERYFLTAQNFETITLEPGEFISVCGRTNAGIAAYMSASLEVREDE